MKIKKYTFELSTSRQEDPIEMRFLSKFNFDSKIVILIQARMNSERLFGKVLLPLGQKKESVLQIILKRLTTYFQKNVLICVATTTDQRDDPIVSLVKSFEGVVCFRGSEEDVLLRYYEAANKFTGSICVRITSDCPFIDPKLIEEGIQLFSQEKNINYLSNTLERTLPRGFDFEIFSIDTLEKAAENATTSYDREHVTPYMYKNKDFYLYSIVYRSPFLDRIETWRLTLDTVEDYALLTTVAEELERSGMSLDTVSVEEILSMLMLHPEWKKINQHILQKL